MCARIKGYLQLFSFISLTCLSGLSFFHPNSIFAHEPHDDILQVAVSPTFETDRTVFIATDMLSVPLGVNIVLKSMDAGVTWDVVPNFPNYEVNGLAISGAYGTDGTIFASTVWGLYKSIDGGEMWTDLTGALGRPAVAVALSPDYGEDQTVFVVGVDEGLYGSSDGGTSWEPMAVPGRQGRLQGGRWSDVGGPALSPAEVAGLQRAPHGYAHERADIVARSGVAFSPAFGLDRTVFVHLEGSGLFKSGDGGAAWTAIGQEMAGLEITILALSPEYVQDQTLYAGTWGGGVYLTTDAGMNWNPVNEGVETLEITSVVISPEYGADATLFATSRHGEMYKTVSAGASWVKLGSLPRRLSGQTDIHYRMLGISPNYGADQTIFLSTFEGFWKSRDGGASWRYSEVLPTYLVVEMKVSPKYTENRSLYATTYGGGMIHSQDGGESWETGNTGLLIEYPHPMAAGTLGTSPVLYVGAGWGPQVSIDGGESWHTMPVLGTAVFPRAVEISPGFGSDLTVAVGVDNEQTGNPKWAWYQGYPVSTDGLFLSGSGGQSWIPTHLNGVGVHSVAFSPGYAGDGTMFAASLYEGLYKSVDGGIWWDRIGETGPMDCCLSRVALSPQYEVDQTLFVSRTLGPAALRGLYRSTDGGFTWTKTAGSEEVTLLDFVPSPNYVVDETLFIATLEKGVLVSTDGGNSMMPTSLSDAYVTALAISPDFEMDGTLYAATYDGILKSEDGGRTWELTTNNTRHEETRPNVVKLGLWSWIQDPGTSTSHVAFSDRPGDALVFNYVGTGVRLLGVKGPKYGMVDLLLDGSYVGRVDLYAPSRLLQQVLFESTGLTFGEHTLTLVIADSHNPLSGGTWVSVDAYDIWL